jgi:hypothetical protein
VVKCESNKIKVVHRIREPAPSATNTNEINNEPLAASLQLPFPSPS